MNKEELLIKYKEPIKIGPHGFVQLIDVMGDDAAICQAARTSYGDGTKTVNDDKNLIRRLMRDKHTSPFEMNEIKLCIQAPIYLLRQWLRHRTANVNEYSLRYSESLDLYETTPEGEWRSQSKTNKQGSGQLIPTADRSTMTSHQKDVAGIDGYEFTSWEESCLDEIKQTYKCLLEMDVAREQARKILPLSTYSRCYWKIDLHNLLHFLRLRMDSHAQQEIRDFADVIWDIVKDWCPDTAAAFKNYVLDSITFSGEELRTLRYIDRYYPSLAEFVLSAQVDIKQVLDHALFPESKNERAEFIRKAKLLVDL